MGVRVAPDSRFRRGRMPPGRRRPPRGGRRRRVWRRALFAILVLAAAVQAARTLLTLPVFRVDRVLVRGQKHLSAGEVLSSLEGLRGQHVLTVDLGDWRERLLASPWVEDASLRRVLPATVEVEVVERTPIGVGRFGGRLFLIDGAGVLIDEYGPQYDQFHLPIIDGLGGQPESGEAVDAARAMLAARVLGSVASRVEVARRLSQLDVADRHNAVVILDGDPAEIHLGEEAFLERLETYLEVEPALRRRVPDLDYVDMRFGARVYVSPASPSASPAARRRAGREPS